MKRYWLHDGMSIVCKTNNQQSAQKKLEALTLDGKKAFVWDCLRRDVDCANYKVRITPA
jgi:hypothetical protein